MKRMTDSELLRAIESKKAFVLISKSATCDDRIDKKKVFQKDYKIIIANECKDDGEVVTFNFNIVGDEAQRVMYGFLKGDEVSVYNGVDYDHYYGASLNKIKNIYNDEGTKHTKIADMYFDKAKEINDIIDKLYYPD